jgi:hypothetical protein
LAHKGCRNKKIGFEQEEIKLYFPVVANSKVNRKEYRRGLTRFEMDTEEFEREVFRKVPTCGHVFPEFYVLQQFKTTSVVSVSRQFCPQCHVFIDIDALKKQKSVRPNEVSPIAQKMVERGKSSEDFESGQRSDLKRIEVPLANPQEAYNQATNRKHYESEDRSLRNASKDMRKNSDSEVPLSPMSKRFTIRNTPAGLKRNTGSIVENPMNNEGRLEIQDSEAQLEAKPLELHHHSSQITPNQPRRPKVSKTIKIPMGEEFDGRGSQVHKTVTTKKTKLSPQKEN